MIHPKPGHEGSGHYFEYWCVRDTFEEFESIVLSWGYGQVILSPQDMLELVPAWVAVQVRVVGWFEWIKTCSDDEEAKAAFLAMGECRDKKRAVVHELQVPACGTAYRTFELLNGGPA